MMLSPGPHWWEASALTTAPSLHHLCAIIPAYFHIPVRTPKGPPPPPRHPYFKFLGGGSRKWSRNYQGKLERAGWRINSDGYFRVELSHHSVAKSSSCSDVLRTVFQSSASTIYIAFPLCHRNDLYTPCKWDLCRIVLHNNN